MKRTIEISLETAKKFYEQDGDLKSLALSAFTEEEILGVKYYKSWEEFFAERGNSCWEDAINAIKNNFPLMLVDKYIALFKLNILRDYYRQGRTPNWNDYESKYCIYSEGKNFYVDEYYTDNHFLSFFELEIAEKFLENFEDLIKQAEDLIS